jgi:hypothetical protein
MDPEVPSEIEKSFDACAKIEKSLTVCAKEKQRGTMVLDEVFIEGEGPEGKTSLELLQAIYRDRSQPLNVRVRCAVEALAHEYPRVSAVAVLRRRSSMSRYQQMKKPFSRFRRF